MTDDLLTLHEAAGLAGVHSNTLRRLIKSGQLPYRTRDLATGDLIPTGAPPPKRFAYLLPRATVHHIASLIGDSVTSSAPPDASPGYLPYTPAEAVEWRVRAERAEAMLEAQKAAEDTLRAHIAALEGRVQDLQRLLPPAQLGGSGEHLPGEPQLTPAETSTRKPGWWARMFGRQG